MKLLIVTQAVDRRHPVLGFFHRWLEEFAKHCETVTVIAQQTGDHALPKNVTVWSLGKERGLKRPVQIRRFWRLCAAAEYDVVWVHMTPVWVLLGAPVWTLKNIPVYLWYEVRRGGWVLKMSLHLVRAVFSATVHGLPLPSAKQRVVGHGIDTALFCPPTAPRERHELLAVGRITRIKRLETIIGCLTALPSDYRLRVIGPVVTQDDRVYKEELHKLMRTHALEGRVTFEATDQSGIAAAMKRARMLLHGAGGGLDKVVLEAMSSGCPIVSCSEAGVDVLPPACSVSPDDMAQAVCDALQDGHLEASEITAQMRSIVERDHSLARLIPQMLSAMKA